MVLTLTGVRWGLDVEEKVVTDQATTFPTRTVIADHALGLAPTFTRGESTELGFHFRSGPEDETGHRERARIVAGLLENANAVALTNSSINDLHYRRQYRGVSPVLGLNPGPEVSMGEAVWVVVTGGEVSTPYTGAFVDVALEMTLLARKSELASREAVEGDREIVGL